MSIGKQVTSLFASSLIICTINCINQPNKYIMTHCLKLRIQKALDFCHIIFQAFVCISKSYTIYCPFKNAANSAHNVSLIRQINDLIENDLIIVNLLKIFAQNWSIKESILLTSVLKSKVFYFLTKKVCWSEMIKR